MEVPWAEASRFGIMTVDEEDRITEFAEKPKEPKSNLASMGIYIFTWKQAAASISTADEADPNSDNDFGKNIIPAMLAAGETDGGLPLRGLLEGRGHAWTPCGTPTWICSPRARA